LLYGILQSIRLNREDLVTQLLRAVRQKTWDATVARLIDNFQALGADDVFGAAAVTKADIDTVLRPLVQSYPVSDSYPVLDTALGSLPGESLWSQLGAGAMDDLAHASPPQVVEHPRPQRAPPMVEALEREADWYGRAQASLRGDSELDHLCAVTAAELAASPAGSRWPESIFDTRVDPTTGALSNAVRDASTASEGGAMALSDDLGDAGDIFGWN
jgi:hypothetical protein